MPAKFMAKKIVFASPEALEVQSGVLWLFYKNQTDRMPVKDAAAALNVTAAQLKTLWQQFGLGNPLSGEIRLEGDTFELKVRLSDITKARLTANSPMLTAETADGIRWEIADGWNDIFSYLLPGTELLLLKGAADRAKFMALVPAAERTVVCRLGQNGESAAVDHPRFETWVMLDKPVKDVPAGTLVAVTIPASAHFYPLPAVGTVAKVLGSADEASTQLEVALTKFALPHVFPEAVMTEASALPDVPDADEADSRIDLRDVPFMTIDSEDARDFDDAVWAKAETAGGWRLLIAIADVSHYVTEGTALDDEAQKRATSVYFPSCVIPMLPEKLSNGLCSLNPGVDRCVMVCDMKVSPEGETTAYQFYPGLIHSHARLTYTAAWKAINGDPEDLLARGGSIEDIYVLYDLFKALRGARNRRGAIDFETQETQVMTGEKGLIEAIVRRDHNDAHRLIEECMLAANVCAADFIERKKAMSLFRVHDAPAPDRLSQLRSMLSSLGFTLGGGDKPSAADFDALIDAVRSTPAADVVQTACLRTMQRAMYTPDNTGHYGLGYGAYTHFTSPIRRYPDLLVHRTIRALLKRRKYVPVVAEGADAVLASSSGEKVSAVLREKKQKKGEAKLSAQRQKQHDVWEKLGLISSSCERRADEASRDVTAWLKCRFMQDKSGRVFEATVTGVNGAGLYVTLDDPFVDGFVHVSRIGDDYYEFDEKTQTLTGRSIGREYKLGTRLKVTLFDVNPEMRRIDFAAVGNERRNFSEGRRSGRRGRFDDADPWGWDWDEDPEDFDFEAFCGERPAKKKNSSAKKAAKKSGKSAAKRRL